MKISVIIPLYNVEQYVSRCLESIINQTYKNLEILVIDDGSTDNSLQVAKSFELKDDRVKVISHLNGGVSKARNKGLEIATGDFIAFVDSDDYLKLNMYETLIENIGDADLIVCGYSSKIDSDINESSKKNKKTILLGEQCVDYLFQMQDADSSVKAVVIWNKLYKKTVFNTLRYNLRYKRAEDEEIIFKILLECSKMVVINDQLYHYYQRPDNHTRLAQTFEEKNNTNVQIINMYKDRLVYSASRGIYHPSVLKTTLNLLIEYYFYSIKSPHNKIFLENFDLYYSYLWRKEFSNKIAFKAKMRYTLFLLSPMIYKKILLN